MNIMKIFILVCCIILVGCQSIPGVTGISVTPNIGDNRKTTEVVAQKEQSDVNFNEAPQGPVDLRKTENVNSVQNSLGWEVILICGLSFFCVVLIVLVALRTSSKTDKEMRRELIMALKEANPPKK